MKRLIFAACTIFLVFGFVHHGFAYQVSIESPTFYWDDPGVTVAPDGSSATLVEADVNPVVLSSDWAWGADGILLLGDASTLSFEYDFYLAPDNVDEFNATIYDYTTGDILRGPEFWSDTASGTFAWDVSDLAGSRIGLDFQLFAYDEAFDSTLIISNITVEAVPVPLPGAMLLLGSGLVGLAGWRKRRSK